MAGTVSNHLRFFAIGPTELRTLVRLNWPIINLGNTVKSRIVRAIKSCGVKFLRGYRETTVSRVLQTVGRLDSSEERLERGQGIAGAASLG